MKATLGTKLNGGQTCLICPRCGFWAAYVEPYQLDVDAFPCPDCQQPLDAVVPPPPKPKCQTN